MSENITKGTVTAKPAATVTAKPAASNNSTQDSGGNNNFNSFGRGQGRGQGRGRGRGQGRGRGRGDANKKPYYVHGEESNDHGKKFNRYPKHIEELEETLKKPIDEKIEQIKKEIAETQEKIDAIQKLKNESQGERSKTIERLKQITQELKKCFADKNIAITESKGLNNELKEHRSIIKDLREKLKYKNYKDPNFISSNLAHLDDDIKSQENTLNTGTHNGQQERAIVNIIDSKKNVPKKNLEIQYQELIEFYFWNLNLRHYNYKLMA